MKHSSTIVGLIAFAFITVVTAHQWTRLRRVSSREKGTVHEHATTTETQADPATSEHAATSERVAANVLLERLSLEMPAQESSPVDDDPSADPVLRRHQVESQVLRMRTYAAQADKDDPFIVSAEDIEAFRQRGDPTLH